MELTILQFLSKQAATGEDVCRILGFDSKAFRLITHELWKNELIQGAEFFQPIQSFFQYFELGQKHFNLFENKLIEYL